MILLSIDCYHIPTITVFDGGSIMDVIQFKEVNCKNCYKCIRSCPVKAISFKDDHAQIIKDECILCGKCLQVCPQNAKSVTSDLDRVKGFINKGQRVYASVAPSFAPLFNIRDEKQIKYIFKRLGFYFVEETAVGAAALSPEYERLLEENKMKNIITTACPTIVNLIEKHYPELLDQLAPLVSPMIAHGRILKKAYGNEIKVVFIGPCLSKKEEGMDTKYENVIDAVLTFEDLEKWMNDENINPDNMENTCNFSENDTLHALNTRLYPAPGGLLKSLDLSNKYNYKFAKFDGIDRCVEILNQIKSGNVNNYFIEMNSCFGACLNGVCSNSGGIGFLEVKDRLTEFVKNSSYSQAIPEKYNVEVDLSCPHNDKSKHYKIPSEAEIIGILNKIGKFSKKDELNCSACGYNSCREKAIAVFNGKADLRMCLPYIRERAESISNVIISSTPNAIFTLNEEFHITEANLAARKMFNMGFGELHNKNIFDILDCMDIITVNETKEDIYDRKYYYKDYGITVEQSILYLKDHRLIVVIMKDITKEENNKKQMHKVRCDTIDIAQKVIEKQMRVAQEIASLLGETTAETKVALTKLKNTIQSEMGDDK